MNTNGLVSQEIIKEIINKIQQPQGSCLSEEDIKKLKDIDFKELVEVVSNTLEDKINKQCYEQFNWLLPNNMTYEKYLDFMDDLKDDYEE